MTTLDDTDSIRWYGMTPGGLAKLVPSWKPSPLDSARWGVKTVRAKIDGHRDIPDSLDLKAYGIGLVIARVPCDQIEIVQDLCAKGYVLCDTLVYWRGGLECAPVDMPAGYAWRDATPEDAADVGRIALESFRGYQGHYHADARMPNEACDAAYQHWAMRAIEDHDSRTVLVEYGGKPVVFGVMAVAGDAVELVLGGVEWGHRSVGLYTHLVRKTMEWGRSLQDAHGIRAIQISTQVTNTAVQKAWARLGLKPDRSLYTLHYWAPK